MENKLVITSGEREVTRKGQGIKRYTAAAAAAAAKSKGYTAIVVQSWISQAYYNRTLKGNDCNGDINY